MFTVVSEFTVAETDRSAFEEGFTTSMKATLVGVPGLRRSQLLRPTKRSNDRGYLALMEFEDEAAYRAYISSEAFHRSHEDTRNSVATGFSMAEFEGVLELTD